MYNHSKEVLSLVDSYKASAYQNLSEGQFSPIVNNPIISIPISSGQYSFGTVNMTFPSNELTIILDYPLADLTAARNLFSQSLVQSCLVSANCSGNREEFSSIFNSCLAGLKISGFSLGNSSVPQLIGQNLYVNLVLFDDGMTLLYPFQLGNFVFSC